MLTKLQSNKRGGGPWPSASSSYQDGECRRRGEGQERWGAWMEKERREMVGDNKNPYLLSSRAVTRSFFTRRFTLHHLLFHSLGMAFTLPLTDVTKYTNYQHYRPSVHVGPWSSSPSRQSTSKLTFQCTVFRTRVIFVKNKDWVLEHFSERLCSWLL